MLKNILGKFCKPAVLGECLRAGGLSSVDFRNSENHVDNECLVTGFLTKQTICRLLREGDISYQHAPFFRAVKAFLVRATEYLLKWCPLEDELLTHATWLDFEHRLEKSFLSVEYFVLKYPEIFPEMNLDQLNEQFLNYQLLATEDIPVTVKESVGLKEEDPYQVDVLWGYLRGVKTTSTTSGYESDLQGC